MRVVNTFQTDISTMQLPSRANELCTRTINNDVIFSHFLFKIVFNVVVYVQFVMVKVVIDASFKIEIRNV